MWHNQTNSNPIGIQWTCHSNPTFFLFLCFCNPMNQRGPTRQIAIPNIYYVQNEMSDAHFLLTTLSRSTPPFISMLSAVFTRRRCSPARVHCLIGSLTSNTQRIYLVAAAMWWHLLWGGVSVTWLGKPHARGVPLFSHIWLHHRCTTGVIVDSFQGNPICSFWKPDLTN